jgi:hypothetical protein
VLTDQEAQWARDPVWTFCRKEKILLTLPGFELRTAQSVASYLHPLDDMLDIEHTPDDIAVLSGRLRLKCDGTRAETRFCLSAKRTSPFKSGGASFQSTTDSRGLRISGSNAGYTKFRGSEGYWLPTPFASLSFTSPPVRLRVPSHFIWTLKQIAVQECFVDINSRYVHAKGLTDRQNRHTGRF